MGNPLTDGHGGWLESNRQVHRMESLTNKVQDLERRVDQLGLVGFTFWTLTLLACVAFMYEPFGETVRTSLLKPIAEWVLK